MARHHATAVAVILALDAAVLDLVVSLEPDGAHPEPGDELMERCFERLRAAGLLVLMGDLYYATEKGQEQVA